MPVSYDVWFRSGADSDYYQEGDNVSLIEVSQSDQDYYQNGVITLFDAPSAQRIGDTVLVKINDILQFDGYVARRQQEINYGKKLDTYQLIGKNYDLWRYHTNSNYLITGMTSYIASSLISDYATGISGAFVYVQSGVNISEELDLSNTTIGDALVKLTEMDGFKFYVDSDDELHYYKPKKRLYNFTVTESDIFDMSPVEEADEDLVNDVTVLGSATGYTSETQVSTTHPSSGIFPSGIIVAQRFKAEDERLAAVKLYLDRTTDPNQPGTLTFEIWNDSSKQLFEDDFDDETYLEGLYNMQIGNSEHLDGNLILEESDSLLLYKGENNPNLNEYYYHAERFRSTFSGSVVYVSMKLKNMSVSNDYDVEITVCSSNASGEPAYSNYENQNTISDYLPRYTPKEVDYTFTGNVVVKPNRNFWVVYKTPVKVQAYDSVDTGKMYATSDDGSTWTKYNNESVDYTLVIKSYKPRGIVSSSSYTEACQYIKVDLEGVQSGATIYISGTNDDGATFQTIKDSSYDSSNKWWNFGSESEAGTYIKYIFSSATCGSDTFGSYTPIIGKCTVNIGDALGSSSGVPESGNKVEFSDDFSFGANDIPYPPSYNSWKTYSKPKLRLTKDRRYWLVMYHNSANSKYWTYRYDPKSDYVDGDVMLSWYGPNFKTRWSGNDDTGMNDIVPSGNLTFSLGWSEADEVTAIATNQDSINLYGRHYRLINDSTIVSEAEAQARADLEVSGSHKGPPRKGTITIDGRTDMETYYRFSSNLTNFDIDDIWDIVSYTQRIDENGFTTEINYGKQPFDLAKHITDLEQEVYGSA